jgi:predicted acetyltransferase
MPAVEVVPVAESEKAELWAYLQDYIRELMPYEGGDIPADGGDIDYPYFDLYWREAGRWPFWGVVDGNRVAFALARDTGARIEMAEFYSFPEYRRSGTALAFARAVMRRFPGPWELSQFAAHAAAIAFWRRVIADWPFEETSYIGPTSGKRRLLQSFTVPV